MSTNRRGRPSLLLLLFGLFASAGCKVGALSGEEMDRQYPLGRMQYLRNDLASEALSEIKAKVGGPYKTTGVSVNPRSLSVEVQDPKTPSNADTYTHLSGGLMPATPRKDWNAPADKLFSIDEVDPARFVPLAKAAVAAASVPQGHVSALTIYRSTTMKVLEATVSVDGPRSSTTVVLDFATGRVNEKR